MNFASACSFIFQIDIIKIFHLVNPFSKLIKLGVRLYDNNWRFTMLIVQYAIEQTSQINFEKMKHV